MPKVDKGETATFEMQLEKETKGTRVFVNEEAPSRQLYISKVSPVSKAKRIRVTIEVLEAL